MVVDWKTNKTMSSFPNLISVHGSPFIGTRRTTLDKYTCQLHIYAHLLEKYYNVKVKQALIVHLECDSYTIYSRPLLPCECVKSRN